MTETNDFDNNHEVRYLNFLMEEYLNHVKVLDSGRLHKVADSVTRPDTSRENATQASDKVPNIHLIVGNRFYS